MKTKTLALITMGLFIASLAVHLNDTYRSSTVARGSYFIKGLQTSSIQKISLQFEKNNEILLERDENQFRLNSHKNYPANTSKVNDLIFKIANLQIREKVGSKLSDEKLKSYQLTDQTKKYRVEIFDADGNKTQSFLVGKKYKNKGHYLLKEKTGEVFLSDGSLWIDSSYKDFVSRVLIDVEKDKIDKILVQAEESLRIEKQGQEFKLVEPQLDAERDKLSSFVSAFKGLRFDDYFKHDEALVKNVPFNKTVKLKLTNKLTYNLKLGEKDGKYFVKASALTPEVPNQMVISQDSDQQDLATVGDMIQAKNTADQFNLEKGSWVYQIDEEDYKKLTKKLKDMM